MNRLTALAAASLLAFPAFAAEPVATLVQQEGTVLVNQGEEFVTAIPDQALKAGDRVMLMEGATAELSFTDGCALPLVAGSLLEIPAVSPCAGGVANVQKLGPTVAQAPGASNDDDSRVAEYLIFGGALAGIVWQVTKDDYSLEPDEPPPPISP